MAIALIADIHGNRPALVAVLNDIARQPDIDQIICLGDVAIFGPEPHSTLAAIKALGGPVIMGNTDAWALAPAPHDLRDERTSFINDIELWGAAALSAAEKSFISTFQPFLSTRLAGQRLLAYHGSPRSFHDAITPDMNAAAIRRLLVGHRPQILVGGHTHWQWTRYIGPYLVVNPGSVGQPLAANEAGIVAFGRWAEYAILHEENGDISVSLNQVLYDFDQLVVAVEAAAMPHGSWWLRQWHGPEVSPRL